jgi:two-component system, OmpR family, phosphate regulon sensor histidine kinase PhoR
MPIAPTDCSIAQETVWRDFLLTLLTMAGHDLRQPLQRMTASHDALAAMLGTEKQQQELAQARKAAEQLAQMLDQLVDALRLREQTRDDLTAPLPLRVPFESLEQEFNIRAQLKGITLRIEHSQHVVVSHSVILLSMLRNLVFNAISYTASGGSVSVSSRRCGAEVYITVEDTGRGIRPDALVTIFDAFRRADDTGSEGLGLGLFIVKHAAELLRHRIEVRSIEGYGSRFTIVTPAFSSRGQRTNTNVRQKLHLVVLPNARESHLPLQTRRSGSRHS